MKNTENLVEAYKSIIASTGQHVDDGYIFSSNEATREQAKSGGIPIVIPTDEHIRSMLDASGNVVKLPFNPFSEDAFSKKDSVSIRLLNNGISTSLRCSIWAIGIMLLKVGLDEKLKTKVGYEINSFLGKLKNVHKNRTINEDVNQKTLDNWLGLFEYPMKLDGNNLDLINITIKRAAKIGKNKYNKVASIYSPFYDALFGDVKKLKWTPRTAKGKPKDVRNADTVIYKTVIEFILSELGDDKVLQVGSNDDHRSGFLSIYQLYLAIAKRINLLCEELQVVDERYADLARIKIPDLDLTKLDEYNGVASTVPNEKEVKITSANQTAVNEKERGSAAVNGVLGLTTINHYNAREESTDSDNGLGFLNKNKRNSNRTRRDSGNNPSATVAAILSGKPVNSAVNNREPEEGEYVEKVIPKYDVSKVYSEAPRYNRRTAYDDVNDGGRDNYDRSSNRGNDRGRGRGESNYGRNSGGDDYGRGGRDGKRSYGEVMTRVRGRDFR